MDDMRNQIAGTIEALYGLLQTLDQVTQRAQVAIQAAAAAAQAAAMMNAYTGGGDGGAGSPGGGNPYGVNPDGTKYAGVDPNDIPHRMTIFNQAGEDVMTVN